MRGILASLLILLLTAGLASGSVEVIEERGLNSLMSLDSEAGVVVAGGVSNGTGLGDFDAVIMMFSGGKLTWARAIGGRSRDLVSEVRLIGTRIVASGLSASTGGGWMFELDDKGRLLWSRGYTAGMVYSFIPWKGGFLGVTTVGQYGVMMRLTGNGSVVASYKLSNDSVVPLVIRALPTGEIYVAGMAQGASSIDFWLARVLDNGTVLWERTYGGSGKDRLYDMEVDGKGITLVGYTLSKSLGASDVDLLVVRTDLDGNPQWMRVVKGPGDNWGNSVSVLPDGSILAGGIDYTKNESGQMWFIRFSQGGSVEGWMALGGGGVDWVRTVTALPNGTVLFAGGFSGRENGIGSLLASYGLLGSFNGDFRKLAKCMKAERVTFQVLNPKLSVRALGGGYFGSVRVVSREENVSVRAIAPHVLNLCRESGSRTSSTSSGTSTPSSSPSSSPSASQSSSSSSPSSTLSSSSSTNPSNTPSSTGGSAKKSRWHICGPAAIIGLMIVPAVLGRRRGSGRR
ncbi:CGP-CTERM sorting domain-containing protein [Thermococcus sp.]